MRQTRVGSTTFSYNSNGNVSANRVTELWKTILLVDEFHNDRTFDIDGDEVTSVRRDFGGSALLVRSPNNHWSAGFCAGGPSSTCLNQHLAANLSPAIEYDVYPYKESTRRRLRARACDTFATTTPRCSKSRA